MNIQKTLPGIFSYSSAHTPAPVKIRFITGFVLLMILSGCMSNADQSDFLDQAFQAPEGITKTDASGKIIGDEDPDDWRVSPDFGHLVYAVEPAWPNPVQTTDDISIILDVRSQAVHGAFLAVSRYSCGMQQGRQGVSEPLDMLQGTLPAGPHEFRLPAALLACPHSTGVESGLKRIFLFDGEWNLISYGDVEII